MSVDQFNRLTPEALVGRSFKLKIVIPANESLSSITFYGGILDA